MSKKPRNIVLATHSGVIAALAALTLTGCAAGNSKTSGNKSPAGAVVSGTLGFAYVGVAVKRSSPPCDCEPEAGTIKLTDAHNHSIYIKTNKSGDFTARVPTGRYLIVAGLNPPHYRPIGNCTMAMGTTVSSGRHNLDTSYLTVGNEKQITLYVGCLQGG